MTSVRIIVTTGRSETDITVEGLDTWAYAGLEPALLDAIRRVCRSYGLTPPVWPEEETS